MIDLSNNYRDAAGLAKTKASSNPNDIAGFQYTIELENALRTQKNTYSNIEYSIGQKILDLDTGIYAEVLAKTPVKKRDLL